MRPLRLELRGFTSFKDATVLDFEGRHLFAITGPTGAGKSSLLDAMTWALYGQVPRVGRETRQLITHGTSAMAVQLDFSLRGDHYRVSRHAPGNLGSRLERQRVDGSWEPLEDRARGVTQRIEDLLGLDFATFTKTVLLPQGAFDTFLRGDERQRRDILTGLLGLEHYEEAGRAARSRSTGARSAAKAQREQIERLNLATPEAITALHDELATLATRLEALDTRTELLIALSDDARASTEAESNAARAAADSAEATRAAERTRNALADVEEAREHARSEHGRLEAERAALGYDETEHRRLDREVQMLDQREAARSAFDAAEAEQREAIEAAARATEEAGHRAGEADSADAANEQAVAVQRAALDDLITAAAVSLATERALGEAANAADDELVVAERAASERDEEARRLAAFDERLRLQQKVLATAEQEHAAAGVEYEAAAHASEAAGEGLGAAEAERDVQAAALEAAKRQHTAIALQRELRPGDPCPVCGEPVGHIEPHAAPELDAAHEALDAADVALRNAREAQGAAAAKLAAAAAQAKQASTALERAKTNLDTLFAESSQVGVDAGALAEAIERAEATAAVERARAETAETARDRANESAAELGLLRATIGSAFDGVEVDPGEPDEPDTVREELSAATEAHRAAAEEAAGAQEESRVARERSREAASTVKRAADRRMRADGELERARERLASLGTEDVDADALRAALLVVQQQAARQNEIEAALAKAAQELAGANARVDAAREALTGANATSTRRADEAQAAHRAAEDARQRLASAWTAAAVEGDPDASRALQLLDRHRSAFADCKRERDLAAQRVETARTDAARAEQMRADAKGYDTKAQIADDLARELQSNHFIAYVQREAMHLLAADAGERLLALSSGRYRLVVRAGAFSVVDRFNGDEERSVKTLSGGETFLASLALALALSERLPEIAGRGGAMSLEALFLDEGFGALDQDSLDTAIGGLETLAGGHRLVGVISHISEVAERLPDRVEVIKNGATSRLVTRGTALVENEPPLAASQ
ncbi:MAG: SMC family ATPase [Chloroflexi bacterium]|nr:SMC family ATPase [Chloroflexota bacterium]